MVLHHHRPRQQPWLQLANFTIPPVDGDSVTAMTAAVDGILFSGRPIDEEHPIRQFEPSSEATRRHHRQQHARMTSSPSLPTVTQSNVLDSSINHNSNGPKHFLLHHHPAVDFTRSDLLRRQQRQTTAHTDPDRPSCRRHQPDPTVIVPTVDRCPSSLLPKFAPAASHDDVDRLPAPNPPPPPLTTSRRPPLHVGNSSSTSSTSWKVSSSVARYHKPTPMTNRACIDMPSLL
ncbi:hypothetical protein ACLOJK_019063 [Asimina triloba]